MLPIAALPLFLKFLDGVDSVAVKKLVRKNPRDETSITQELCDLFEEEYSDDAGLPYPLEHFREDLALAMPLSHIRIEVETHQYSPLMERWVTQSDIGLVLDYKDHFLPGESWNSFMLLQAKRLFPERSGLQYRESSKFASIKPEQHKRILELNEYLGCELVKYLLYCPRPASLDTTTAGQLTHLRNRSIDGNIFDYARGLALHDELKGGGRTLAAGVFVADVKTHPKTFAETHASIFSATLPLSWMLTLEFARNGLPTVIRGVTPDFLETDQAAIVRGIVEGDVNVTHALAEIAGRNPEFSALRVLPRHTIQISVEAGAHADPEQRTITR